METDRSRNIKEAERQKGSHKDRQTETQRLSRDRDIQAERIGGE